MKKYVLILCLLFNQKTNSHNILEWMPQGNLNNKAIIKKPVADFIGDSLQIRYKYPKENIQKKYNNLGFSPEKGPASCLRVCQLLVNEVVEIIEQNGSELKCKIYSIFYERPDGKIIDTFWTLKGNVELISNLNNKYLKYIPAPYDHTKSLENINKNILTLSYPWKNQKTNITYSAGTRFIRHQKKDTKHLYAVKTLNFDNKKTDTLYIPKANSIIDYPKDSKRLRKLFINTINKWIHLNKKNNNIVIPYVWGGRSFINKHPIHNFFLKEDKFNNQKIMYWQRETKDNCNTGFDCSGLVLRAAQTCGLPYFFQNTTTLALNLKKLTPEQPLENGDLIWFKGHVMIINNIKDNKIIESAGYGSKWGKVHETNLNKIFHGINNYNDLLDCYYNQKPLKRLNGNGQISLNISNFNILKILN